MEFELHIRGTIDEISQITTLIQNKVNREKSLFDSIKTSTTSVSPDLINDLPKRKKYGGTRMRAVDILIGSAESGFALYKSYNTMQAAAQSLGLKEASNIAHYLANDRIYKKMYKFQYRDAQ